MATGHLKYGGSGIPLTLCCPGNVKAQEGLRTTSESAERGTRHHAYLEAYLRESFNDTEHGKADKTELNTAVECGKAIKQVIAELGMSLEHFEIERMLVFHPDYPMAGGTPDLDGHNHFDVAVIDAKFGRGQVSADENHQLLFYACAKLNNLDPFTRGLLMQSGGKLHLVIVQPNEDGSEIAVRKWSIPLVDVPAYEALYRGVIDRAEANPDERIAGEHCSDMWCAARTTCPVYANWLDEKTGKIFSRALEGEVEQPRGERLAKLLDAKDRIMDLIKQAEADAKEVLKVDADGVPGWHLADSMSNRAWADEKKAEKALKAAGLKADEFAPRKLLTPAKVEALFKSKKIDAEIPETVRETTGVRLVRGERAAVFAPLAVPNVTGTVPEIVPDPKALTPA